ncbi:MAG: flagellar hook-basal body complex protein FliE [Alphaproteobacteria bacterium]|nr:flagellar hook-basal body complex protein FliE [Alphaproteobacteria bacterium]
MSDLGVSAAKAYMQTASTLANNKTASAGEAGGGFGDLLNSAISSVQNAGTGAEQAITNATLGKGDMVDVVTAVAAAEASLQSVVAVRDQVIKAYQDIMRMPI